MIQKRIRALFTQVQDGINTGFIFGIGLIFLTLIGLPSDESEALASISVELFLLISFYMGWRLTRIYSDRKKSVSETFGNILAFGVSASIVFLLFLSLINSWHADGTDVEGLYFANMNTYPMHVLSGIPLEELEQNPEVDPLTNEIPSDATLRTSPFQITFDENTAIFSLGPIHIGGLYGFALLLIISALLGSTRYAGALVQYTDIQQRTPQFISNSIWHKFAHWFILTLPISVFALFWLTVEHQRGTEMAILGTGFLGTSLADLLNGIIQVDNFQIINLTDVLGLTSDSLIDAPSIQLGLSFLIVILSIVALRRATIKPHTAPYLIRVFNPLSTTLVLLLLALWRIESSDITLISPSIDIFGLTSVGWTRAVFFLGSFLICGYILLASRDDTMYEVIFAAAVGLTIFLISPLYMNQYQTFVMGRVMLAVMFGLGLNIVVGYAGLLDLGYVAFYAIGAYTFAFIAIESEQFKLSIPTVNDLGWTLTATILLAPLILFAALYAWQQINPRHSTEAQNARQWKQKKPVWINQPPFIATVALLFVLVGVLSLIGDYLAGSDLGIFSVFATNNYDTFFSGFLIAIVVALLTGAFAGIMLGFPVLRLRGDYLAIVTLGFGEIISLALKNLDSTTGGPSGALGVPKPVPDGTSVPVSNLVLLYLSIVGAFVVIIFSTNLRNSRIGRAWLAMRSDEDIAQAMGINLVNVKLLAFSIGASMAALAGMLFAARQNSIFPDDFNLEVSINVLSLVIIGGMGSVPGVVIGSIVLIGLPELLRPIEDYRIMAFGLLLIVTMVTRPEGLLPSPPPELEEHARELAQAEGLVDGD